MCALLPLLPLLVLILHDCTVYAVQGKDLKFRVGGLKPNTEYIMCVKAIYDDGSFLWSESKAYMTKI